MIKRCMQINGSSCRLVGRTYDLKRVYRQLGVCEEHYKLAWVAVCSTEHGCVKLFLLSLECREH